MPFFLHGVCCIQYRPSRRCCLSGLNGRILPLVPPLHEHVLAPIAAGLPRFRLFPDPPLERFVFFPPKNLPRHPFISAHDHVHPPSGGFPAGPLAADSVPKSNCPLQFLGRGFHLLLLLPLVALIYRAGLRFFPPSSCISCPSPVPGFASTSCYQFLPSYEHQASIRRFARTIFIIMVPPCGDWAGLLFVLGPASYSDTILPSLLSVRSGPFLPPAVLFIIFFFFVLHSGIRAFPALPIFTGSLSLSFLPKVLVGLSAFFLPGSGPSWIVFL